VSYTALARKWRPRTFAELIGQDHVRRALVNALESGRVPVDDGWRLCSPRRVCLLLLVPGKVCRRAGERGRCVERSPQAR